VTIQGTPVQTYLSKTHKRVGGKANFGKDKQGSPPMLDAMIDSYDAEISIFNGEHLFMRT